MRTFERDGRKVRPAVSRQNLTSRAIPSSSCASSGSHPEAWLCVGPMRLRIVPPGLPLYDSWKSLLPEATASAQFDSQSQVCLICIGIACFRRNALHINALRMITKEQSLFCYLSMEQRHCHHCMSRLHLVTPWPTTGMRACSSLRTAPCHINM